MTHILRIDELKSSTYRSAADKRQAQLDAMPVSLRRKLPSEALETPSRLRAYADKVQKKEERDRFNKLSRDEKINFKWDFLKKALIAKRDELCENNKTKWNNEDKKMTCTDGSPMFVCLGAITQFDKFTTAKKAAYLSETYKYIRIILAIYHRSNGAFDIRCFLGFSLSKDDDYDIISWNSVRENASMASIEKTFNDCIKSFINSLGSVVTMASYGGQNLNKFFDLFHKHAAFNVERTERYDDKSRDNFGGYRSYAASVTIDYKYIDYIKIKNLPKLCRCTQKDIDNELRRIGWKDKNIDWKRGYLLNYGSRYEYWD